MRYEQERPTVKIFYTRDAQEQALRQLQLGREEEGIHFDCALRESGSAAALAYSASQESRLSVGLGLDRNGYAMQFSKLPEDKPLFQIPFNATIRQLRALGSNAARMVKHLPFKTLEP